MILIDYKQIANLIFHSGFNDHGYELDPFQHKFLSYVLFTKGKFKKYGDIVICLDSAKYWRKDIFPYYKASRAKGRENSDLNYDLIYRNFNHLENDIKNHMPWKVVSAPKAEADDIIAILATRFHKDQNILIVSADKDFLQLQKYPNISQYSPKMKSILEEKNPEMNLREKIIRGDAGDGIPSIHCKDDKFINENSNRAKPITKVWLNEVLKQPNIKEALTEEERKGYERNERLIDFSFIPSEISSATLESYMNYVTPKKSGVYSYLNERGYLNLLELLEYF